MNQSRAFFISLAFAFGGMGLVAFYISEQEKKMLEVNGNLIHILVAKKNINEMQALDYDDLDSRAVPNAFVQPGGVKLKSSKEDNPAEFMEQVKDIHGMVALVPIQEGEQLLITKLAPKGAQTGLAPQVAANKRAMSINIADNTGLSKLVKPGDYVDIVGSVTYPGADGASFKELKTFLQNVRILATGEMVTNNLPQIYEMDPLTQKKVAVSGRSDQSFTTVTVEVTPDQAQVLILAQEQSPLYLTLRNPVDRVETQVGSTTIDELLGPDSKRAEAREREQRKSMEEARRMAELERLRALQTPGETRRPAAAIDPLEAGGGVLE